MPPSFCFASVTPVSVALSGTRHFPIFLSCPRQITLLPIKARPPESIQELLATDVAMLATVGRDGYPQVTALWFLYDDENGLVKLSLNTARQKTKNLQSHPECTLFILDRANPMRTLEIRATAMISPDNDCPFAIKLGRRYGNIDLRVMDQPGEPRVGVTFGLRRNER